ncbi:MAG: hypothetical protein ACK4ZC_05780 [Bacteroidota bacterium]|nr:hypothetical protein [Bacteroidota bacterium]MCE2840370.1 hypothetical protein [Bacteroidota bacterium]
MRKIWFSLIALGLLGASCHRRCPAYARYDAPKSDVVSDHASVRTIL